MMTCQIQVVALLTILAFPQAVFGERERDDEDMLRRHAQVGPRPFYLVEKMPESPLRDRLLACRDRPVFANDFSIGHRGAPLQFPEHTHESYTAAGVQGAGIIECDVTFTRDRQLVCRHAQCDLHTTTNILETPLASKCSEPFTPAEFDPVTGEQTRAASARCCTSDITLAEFKTLCGKMDAADPNATTVAEYVNATASWRTDLYSTCGTLMTHRESIALIQQLGAKFTPELKSPQVPMPFQGEYTQEQYARQMINEYRDAGVAPHKVWAQSFNLKDVLYWVKNAPRFGRQAVFLDSRPYNDTDFRPDLRNFRTLRRQGVRIVAPPMFALLELDNHNRIKPSSYARLAKRAGLDIITWTLERSGRIREDMKEGTGGVFYYQTTLSGVQGDGDIMTTLDVLGRDVGVLGVFSDWPATTTFYASCMGLR